MALHPLAGKPAPDSILTNIPRLVADYYSLAPDVAEPAHRVAFGTSGHRGSSEQHSFNEPHILAISQAVAEYRRGQGIDGPLFLGMDTHALSEPALISAVEVLAANGVEVMLDADAGYTPTPVISHAILGHNRGRQDHLADGVVITPSHNPPADGGFKYNPPSGGPADAAITGWIERRANELLAATSDIRRWPWERAVRADNVHRHDYLAPYVNDLGNVIDMEVIRESGIRIGADPMGGSGIAYWQPVAERYGVKLERVSQTVDPSFRFMHVDKDGKIRMDCSSPSAMAGLIGLKDRYDIAFGNDTDFDRHGIVTPSVGLMNPNHYLAVAINWLFAKRRDWPAAAAIGKTLVSSSMIARSASSGSLTDCSTAPSASAARKARAPRSCALTARPGSPTRTVSSWTCWPPRSPPAAGATPANTTAISKPGSGRRCTNASTRRPAARRRRSLQTCPRSRSPPPSLPASRSLPGSPKHPAMAPPSVASRSSPQMAGLPPGLRAPRISTRFTPRVSSGRTTCAASRKRRAGSLRPH
jgi:phosphomannomutase